MASPAGFVVCFILMAVFAVVGIVLIFAGVAAVNPYIYAAGFVFLGLALVLLILGLFLYFGYVAITVSSSS